MSDTDKLARWHELLKDPVRQKILLKLGQLDKLSIDELMKEVKINDQSQLYSELQALTGVVSKLNYTGQGGANDFSDKYTLTEEGHDIVDWMIAFPELKNDNYQEKIIYKNGKAQPQRLGTAEILLILLVIIAVTGAVFFLVASHFPWHGIHTYEP